MISFFGILRHSWKDLINSRPFSLYRFTEYLIEMALLRREGYRKILEVGPGSDPFVAQIPQDLEVDRVLAIDYCHDIIEQNKETFEDDRIEFRAVNLTDPVEAETIEGDFDYAVCNATVEHVPDDQALVDRIYERLRPGGAFVFSTVMHQWMYNDWDYAMGHYKRYSRQDLKDLCHQFEEVQIIETSLIQEIVRPLFFSRINHLLDSTLEENNLKVGFLEHAEPPYASIYGVVKYLMPLYFAFDWFFSKIIGGIVIVVARKSNTPELKTVRPVEQLAEAV